MTERNQVVVGIDLGTQGVRVIAVTSDGDVLAKASIALPTQREGLPEGWHQQNPEDGWNIVCQALRSVIRDLPSGISVAGLAVDSTSGSLIVVDGDGSPLYPSILYNDSRSRKEAAIASKACSGLEASLGYSISSSFALPKILWLQHEQPQLFQKTVHFLSATDFIIGRLTGEYGVSDYNNALKTGYDVLRLEWPGVIESGLGIPISKLPRVVSPGTFIAKSHGDYYAIAGLPAGIAVYAGATDGTSAQYSSGAVTPGAWNSTLGTTLVFKGITENLCLDPYKRIYCHRHPEGWWMPGGASNTGAEWIGVDFPNADLAGLDQAAVGYFPTSMIWYPLARKGERFPFIATEALGFFIGHAVDDTHRFAAGLEGTALTERLAFELLESVGTPVIDPIIVTGGASRSDIWVQLRATVLNHALIRPLISDTAMGAAILAGSGCWFGSLGDAVKNMVRMGDLVEPDQQLINAYEDKYNDFKRLLVERNYLT